jgi:hypothetical protein
MMPVSDDIIIRLIRSDDNNEDDIIKIRRRIVNQPSFLVKYTDGKVKNRVWVCDKTINELMSYLQNLFLCLSYDVDPFHKLQVSIATFPIIFIRIDEDFNEEIRFSLLEVIHNEIVHPASYFTT